MAQNIPSYVPSNGLVGWWPFNGNANDESGNGNNGTVNGATLSADRDGKANSAYSFGGNNISTIDIKSKLQFNDFTFAFWYYALDTTLNSLIDWRDTLNNKPLLNFSIDEKLGGLIGRLRDNVNVNPVNLKTNSIKLGYKWHFITFSLNQNLMSIYLNGELNNTSIYNQSIWSLNHLQLGSNLYDKAWFYTGKLDDIAIYNRALSDQEVKQLYQGCSSETATSTSFNSVLLTTGNTLALSAVPQGGVFKAASVLNNQFVPSKAKIGLNKVQYSFKNSQGCNDSTLFSMIVADTVGNTCKKYDTILKLKFKLTTGINANQMTSMTLYPNPTTDVLYIEIGDAKALDGYRYRILDAVGKEVYNQLVKNPKTEIPLKSLGAAGMYLFEVIDQQNKTIQSNKIVLE
jgi:hypothetical protein